MISFTVSLRQNQNLFHGEFMIKKSFKMNFSENLDLCPGKFMAAGFLSNCV